MTALLYPAALNALTAEPGQGKTWVALIASAQLLQKGERVLYLDYEGNRRIIGDRLRALGVKPDQAGIEQMPYVRPGFVGPAEKAALCEIVRRVRPALVVVDGVAKSLAKQGLSEDKAPDVLAWMDLLCWPFTELGAAVLTLDHVVKDKENQGRWARGSSAKLGEIDGASYMLRGRFSRERPGSVRMVLTKDREGHIGEEGRTAAVIYFTPGPDGALGYRIERPSEDGASSDDHLSEKKAAVLAALEAAEEPLGKNAIASVVFGKKVRTLEAIDALEASGEIEAIAQGRFKTYRLPRALKLVSEPADEDF